MIFHLDRALLPAILVLGLCGLTQPGLAADNPAAATPPAAVAPAPAVDSAAPASSAPPAASTPPAESAPPVNAASAPAAAAPSAGIIGPPPPGKGQIVFFRSWNILGAAISYIVREDKAELGEVTIGSYFVIPVDPGTHTYTVHSEAKDNLTLEVDAGETYYVQGSVGAGLLVGRPHIAPSDEATFDKMAKKLKLSTWTAPTQVASGN